MIGKILNYTIKIAIIIIGILLLSGYFIPENASVDAYVFQVLGVVFILFGIYRLVSYRSALKRYNFKNDNE